MKPKTYNSREEAGNPPVTCPECTALIQESNLEWVLCGGQIVGFQKPTYTWQLKPKDEPIIQRERTRTMQRLAWACRLIYELKEHVKNPDMLKRIETFLKPPQYP